MPEAPTAAPDPNSLDALLDQRLDERRRQNRLRRLKPTPSGIDFCANDYLGLAFDPALAHDLAGASTALPPAPCNGSTGSRLISGNSALAETIEAQLARDAGHAAALIFSTGYSANLGLMSALGRRGDTLILDQFAHASQIDGARLSKAEVRWFAHNDLDALAAILEEPREGRAFVGVESVYSMDGDEAPLTALCDLCERFGAGLIVDEAHAVGVFGPRGLGLVAEHGLQSRVLATVFTFGKALGGHGALVAGGDTLRQYLINFARSFVFSTAPPPHQLHAMVASWYRALDADDLRDALHANIARFRDGARALTQGPVAAAIELQASRSAVQSLVVPGEKAVRATAAELHAQGFAVVPIVAPTVPVGRERLRLCLSTRHSFADIDALCAALEQLAREHLRCA